MDIKSLSKNILGKIGLDVRLVRNVEAHQQKTWEEKWGREWLPFLQNHNIKTIIDIGANAGQFATMIHKVCPNAKIYSFEPIVDCFKELQKTLERIPGAISFNLALGDTNGTLVINRSEFTPCSSMLQPSDFLKRDWPDAAIITKQVVQMNTLDDFFSNEKLEPEIFIKIDVQGYEPNVIRGGRATLAKASLLAIEACFYEQYEGQLLFDDLYKMMIEQGFAYRGNASQSEGISKIDGRLLYADAIFENKNLTAS